MISSRSASKGLKYASYRRSMIVLGGVLAILLLCNPLFPQGVSGRILGTVTDQSGGVVSGATVLVVDTDRGVTKTLVTNDAGEYNATNLTPGKYKVRAEAKGFKTIERENIVLEVGKEIRADLSLVPGAVAETMTITESIPLVETTNATLGGTLNNADINDMPLNGRNYQSLMTLRPGVVSYAGGGPWTQSTNNIRPDESGWMLDGVINVNFYDARPIANMPSPITDAATILPIDAIQEFNMEENPKAEFGWKPGAVVNVGVKSGTNTIHGSAYGFYRSSAWDARNFFNPAPVDGTCLPAPAVPAVCDKTPTQLKQFGGVIGGPIKKDKLFFFGGYEGLRSIVGNSFVTSIPETGPQSPSDPQHSMADAIMALQQAGIARSLVSEQLVGCTEPTATTVTCTGGLYSGAQANTTNFLSAFPNINTSNNGVGKIDYHINSKNTLNGMVFISRYNGSGEDHPFVNKIFTDSIPIPTYSVRADWIWNPNSRLVNDMKFGYDKVTFDFVPNDAATIADGKGYPINTGATEGGLPNIYIKGFGPSGGFQLGTWHNRPNHFATPYFDGQDSVSYLVGKHTLKFGGEIAHIQVESQSKDTARGRIDFKGKQTPTLADCKGNSCPLEDFFSGNPTSGQLFVNSRSITLNWMSYAGFFQDDWRVSQKLTLNLGLRYSYVSPMKEANGLIGSFDPAVGMVQQNQLGGSLWKPDRKNFSPRAGFAWDLTGKGTTVVRGGFSIMYSVVTAATLLAEAGLQNTTGTSIALVPTGACTTFQIGPCPTTFGGTIASGIASLPGSALHWKDNSTSVPLFPQATLACDAATNHLCNIMAVDPNLLTPYVTNYSLGIQHAFSNNLSLEVEYVGNRGSRLTGFRDLNQADRTGVQPFSTTFPYLNFVNQMSNDSHSNYNSLQTTLTKRISHGLSFIAGYTYGHGLDNGSLNRQGFLPQDSTNPGAEYASSDFDTRHRFTFTTSYEIPGIKGFGQLLEGWKLNSIISLQSALPWLIFDTGNNFSNSGDSADRWDFFGNPADFKSGKNSIPFCAGPTDCSFLNGVSGSTIALADPATMWSKCTAVAADPNTLATAGCFVVGNSVMTPPALGHFGTMGRNMFRDTGYKNVDFSVFKTFTYRERFSAQFRVELFNIFNHPTIANPFGSVGGSPGNNDPSSPSNFGCGCSTPDVAAGNPIVGSGSARAMQVGLKLAF